VIIQLAIGCMPSRAALGGPTARARFTFEGQDRTSEASFTAEV